MILCAETNPEAVDVITKLIRRSELLEEYKRQRLLEGNWGAGTRRTVTAKQGGGYG